MDREGRADRTQAALQRVWEKYRGLVNARVAQLEEAAIALIEGRFTLDQQRAARAEAHKLAGTAGSFGFPGVTEAARILEFMLLQERPLTSEEVRRFADLTARIRQDINKGQATTVQPDPLAEQPVPGTTGPHLLIVEADEEHAARLAAEAASRGVHARIASSAVAARYMVSNSRPDVVLLDLTPPHDEDGGLALLWELSEREPEIPVVVTTTGTGFYDRLEVAVSGAKGFIQKPTPPSNVIEIVMSAWQSSRPEPARILLVDDDPVSLAVTTDLIHSAGFIPVTLNDPRRFWETLASAVPDMIILDYDMTGATGVELCQMLRLDRKWRPVPVLFLTAYTDLETVNLLFRTGADDFVPKAVLGSELVARIRNRLERVRWLKQLSERDQLTGLFTRTHLTGSLERYLRLADRHQQPLTVAVLNVDGFKRINAVHGTAVGDEVLRRLGRLIDRLFRSEDVAGRWGGAEILFGMYGLSVVGARARMLGLLQALQEERFEGSAGARFTATFSVGVAERGRDGLTLNELYKAADEALSRSKALGPGSVVGTWSDLDSDRAAWDVDVALVEDDEVLAELLLHTMRVRGLRVEWLKDGPAAVASLAGKDPKLRARLILMDVGLPGMDGFSVLRKLAAHGVLERTRVIMLTARTEEQEIVRAFEFGALDHVAKPVSPPVLIHRIQRALEKQQ